MVEITFKELESLARNLIERFPQGYLSEIEIRFNCTCAAAIRVPEANRSAIDTPRVILEGSYQELAEFGHIYNRLRSQTIAPAGAKVLLLYTYAPETFPGEITYWNDKGLVEA